MRIFTFQSELTLPRPRDEVFPFFADARNLQALTPPWLNFEILSKGDVEMKAGAMIQYRIQLHGIPVRWDTEITLWEPPERFVDEQRRGPYRLWRHEHAFLSQNGKTLVRDHVDYAVPGGRLVQKFFVEPDVEKIFDFRRHKLSEIFRLR